jgi:transposase
MAKKGSRFRKHLYEFKLEIVKRHLQNGVSVEVLAKENELEPKLIRTWRTSYLQHGEQGLEAKPKGRPKGSLTVDQLKTEFTSELDKLQYENATLKLEVARLKKLQEL